MATIKDVAKHAAVSIATVSRIINNRGPISDKTRTKVYESMKALNYQPNEMARALQKQKSNMIGLIVPSIRYEFFARLIEAVEETCHRYGYRLMIGRSNESEEREVEMVSMLEANKVDGILLCSRLGDTSIYTDKATMPIVSIDREIAGFSSVTSDNYRGGRLAAAELLAAGSVSPILFGDKIPDYMPMHLRNKGFFEECESLGVTAGNILAPHPLDDTDALVQCFLEGIRKQSGVDGVFITSDALAAEIICSEKVRAEGVLEDIPVISYDGLEISRKLNISSIIQPIDEMGITATEQLIGEIEEQKAHIRCVLPVRIAQRSSTARPGQADAVMGNDAARQQPESISGSTTETDYDFRLLTEYIDSLENTYGIPAVDCKITKDHQVVYRHMSGYSDPEKKTALTPKTLFRFFSATKLVTMTAVLQQIERGSLGLYDEVRDYLPEFDRVRVADRFKWQLPMKWPGSDERCHYAHNAIRIIDLMTMTAGLSYDTASAELKELKAASNNQATTRAVAAAIAGMPLAYEPGTRYLYGLGHDVLAAVIEVVSGKKYSEYLKEHIFAPLGAEELYFHWEKDKRLAERVCTLYRGVWGTDQIIPDDGVMTDGFKITANHESGGAGLAGTVDAYSRFIDALANEGVGASGARILSPESVKMFTVPYTTGQMSEDFAACGKPGYEYGLGVRVLVDGSQSPSPEGEFGWDGAAGAYALVDTANHISIFYAQHVAGYPRAYSEIHPKIRDIAYECLQRTKR